MTEGFRFYDLRAGLGSRDIDIIFPGWSPGDERVLAVSPHDDDALLGAGYALVAAQENGGVAHVAICCDGSAGYSRVQDRNTIVERRRRESMAAYGAMGIPAERVHYLGFPDFSLIGHLGWKLATGHLGTLQPFITLLRRIGATRLLIPNGYREHLDHTAAYDLGRYDGPQAGDAVGADWGKPSVIRSTLQYAVWADLSPEDALVHGAPTEIRANRALVAPYALEHQIAEALAAWESQQQIIARLLEQRRERDCGMGLMELYVVLDPRPKLDYAPYVRLLNSLPPVD
ncbi:MAG: PIG-L deacetylase family protein [Anaerolineae bacterium]